MDYGPRPKKSFRSEKNYGEDLRNTGMKLDLKRQNPVLGKLALITTFLPLDPSGGFSVCAEHVQQRGGGSSLPILMEEKG